MGKVKTMLMGAYDEESAAALLDTVVPTLRAGAKVIVTAASFRQAKKALHELASRSNAVGIRADVSSVETIVHGRRVVATAIGDGAKFRGLEADLIVFVESYNIAREAMERVVLSHASWARARHASLAGRDGETRE